ncbi:O-antigen ligase family protein [Algoriphagus sp. Y33]|uniref:O-antigen ligase family protein n=1 Tax=Algoriphagus sp. Y33 TaxID=2772483 RepID=UPI0017849DBE|nr:O-antigen ligase family protein [Algoriphagus sp. Y33]
MTTTILHKNYTRLSLLLLGMILVAVLPFWGFGDLPSFLQADQTAYLLVLSGLFGVASSLLLLNRSPYLIKLTSIDLLLLLVILYYLINCFIIQTNPTVSSRLYDLFGLTIIYILVRSIGNLSPWPVLVFPVFGCLVQVVYGELQLLGVFPSLHPLFPLTGSFFNPGPYAGYLAIVFPIALGAYFYFKPGNSPFPLSPFLIKYGFLVICLGIIIVLPVTGSRAAWLAVALSSIFLYATRYRSKSIESYLTTQTKKITLAALALILVLLALSGMYLLRKDSVDGRLLIWKASMGIIQKHVLTGVGLDRFEAVYMESQADYFRSFPNDPAIALADDTTYAFNELLLIWTEQGTIGLSLVLILLVMAFRIRGSQKKPEIWTAQAGLIALLVFGMFSYPSNILPIKLCGILYLVILAKHAPNLGQVKLLKDVRRIIPILLIIISVTTMWQGYRQYQATLHWKEALTYYHKGSYLSAIETYDKAYPHYSYDGEFLMNYGKALSMAEEHGKAIDVLEKGTKHLNNSIVQTTLGNSYKAIFRYEKAEMAYQMASDMLPDRLYPKYLLAKLYDLMGEKGKMESIALYLLNKEPKVPSQAVDEIKQDMKDLLEMHSPQALFGQDNAIWTEGIYLRGENITTGEKLTDLHIIKYAKTLKKYHVKYAYLFAGPYKEDGHLPEYPFSKTAIRSVKLLKEHYPEIVILPWIGGVQNKTVYINDSSWVKNAVEDTKLLVETLSVPGVHVDFEYIIPGDSFLDRNIKKEKIGDREMYGEHVNNFHKQLRSKLPEAFISSVMVATSPESSPWKRKFSLEELQKLTQYIDQLSFLYYDTQINDQETFQRNCTALIQDIKTLKAINDIQYLVAIGTFVNRPELQKYRNMEIENVPNSLNTIKTSSFQIDPSNKLVDGIAIFCDWETNLQEWNQFYVNWVEQK